MKNKFLKTHIAAVSLIEIMMVFAIIGIITGACMSLTKPKDEYVKKIQLYSAFTNLEYLARVLVKEGSIDFANDETTCSSDRVSNWVCKDLSGDRSATVLPKTVTRCTTIAGTCTSAYATVDPGITTTTSSTYTYYSTLGDTDKAHYKYLQGGLCQRMSAILNLSDTNITCSVTINDDNEKRGTLINDQSAYPTSFLSYRPQMYLPNGQVIYMSKYLYHDCLGSKKIKIRSTKDYALDAGQSESDEYDQNSAYVNSGTACTNTEAFVNATISSGTAKNTTNNALMIWTNESRQKILKKYTSCGKANEYVTIMKDVWENNNDYFIIYVDINCKMSSSTDRQCGPDVLNKDIFAFKMYRGGMVMPDYASGFPQKYLLAKLLYKDGDKYVPYSEPGYSMLPLVFSRCYANLAGNYSTYDMHVDPTGICTPTKTSTNFIDPLTENEDGAPCTQGQCKSITLKPSFFVR